MRGKRLSDDLVHVLCKKHDEGHSTWSIAKELDVLQKAVRLALKRPVLNTHNQLKVDLGRPRCTSTTTDRAIVVALRRRRFFPYHEISSPFGVSRYTVRRRANESGVRSRVAH
jgi:hypothetical protein